MKIFHFQAKFYSAQLILEHGNNNVIANALRLQSDNFIWSLFVLTLQFHNLFYQHHWIHHV